jgi:3-phosphoshikimate 1-carboxyvinyltransferase
VACLFADGPSRLRGLGTLRAKETDRLAALESELAKLGAVVEVEGDTLAITPGVPQAAEIETYDDHRMAMSFALAGLRIPGVVIGDPECVSKTWPEYFDVLDAMCRA